VPDVDTPNVGDIANRFSVAVLYSRGCRRIWDRARLPSMRHQRRRRSTASRIYAIRTTRARRNWGLRRRTRSRRRPLPVLCQQAIILAALAAIREYRISVGQIFRPVLGYSSQVGRKFCECVGMNLFYETAVRGFNLRLCSRFWDAEHVIVSFNAHHHSFSK
jgi:hypothetical protein